MGSAYRFGDLVLDLGRHVLERNGQEIEIPNRSYELLRALVCAAPNLLTHDQIVGEVWSGRATSPETITQRVKLLRDALRDDARQPRYIHAVRGRGYRIIPQVEALDEASTEPVPFEGQGPMVLRLQSAIIALLVFAGGFVLLDNYLLVRTPVEMPPLAGVVGRVPPSTMHSTGRVELHNSVAVLPFDNLGGDPADAFFAAGVHEEILNQLAQIETLSVIDRTSMMRYADSDKSIAEIASDLNVKTVMEGSVRHGGDRVLVTVQLIDPGTETYLWSASYDRRSSDILEIQENVALNVARTLEAESAARQPAVPGAALTVSPERPASEARCPPIGLEADLLCAL